MNYKKNVCLLTALLFLGFIAKAQIHLIRDGAKDAFLVDVINDQINLREKCNDLLEDQYAQGHFKSSYVGNDFPRGQLNDLVLLCQAYALWTDPDFSFTLNVEPDAHTLAELETGIRKGINWWYNNVDYNVPAEGWWWNEIGKQRRLQKISVLFYFGLFDVLSNPLPLTNPSTGAPVTIQDLSGNNITTLLGAISADFVTSIADPSNPSGPNDNNTGANKTDVAGSIIAKGLLLNNMGFVDAGRMYLECVMEFSTNVIPTNQRFDGMREDYSFNQHNELNPADDYRAFLYSGGYGKDFMYSVATWGAAFNKTTNYNYTPEAKANFLNYVMKGYRWMLIGDMTDYSANGRTIAREYPGSNGRITDDEMTLILRMSGGTATTVALSKMKNQLGGKQSFGSKHHKHFWISDYVCHQEMGYFSSLRMCSDRTLGTEIEGGDNRLGFWLPYGATFIYQDGKEYIRPDPNSSETDPTESEYYENIFPFWNWSYVPGVTCSEADDPENDLLPGDNYDDGTYSNPGEANTQIEKFVGNASNDSYGVSAMSFRKNYYGGDVSAKKAWFHFGEEIIALGADIDGANLYTTVNQCLLEGNVEHTIANTFLPANTTMTTSAAIPWVQHDGIAYIFPETQAIKLSNNSQTGSWDAINGGSSTPISGSVFRAWIEHTGNNAEYYYIIAPGKQGATYLNNIQKLSNTTAVQAVRKTISGQTLAGIVFYPTSPNDQTFTPATVNVADPNATAINLSTNRSCALLYDEINGEICISKPNRTFSEVVLTVGVGNNTPQNFTFSLPTGAYAGTSTCMKMNFQSLIGNVNSHCIDEEGLPNIQITGDSGNPNVSDIQVTTNTNGQYSIPVANTGRLGSSLTITPSNNSNPRNGVSTYDLVMMSKHILQTQLLDSPYRRIAADVNNSGTITTFDMVELRKLILFINPAFVNNTSWRFVDADYEFPDTNPWTAPFPEAITLTPLNLFSRNVDFKGIKIGDLNCSYKPEDISEFCEEEEEVKILAEDKALRQNDVFTYALRTENFNNIEAYQFALRFDATKLQYQNIQQGDLNRAAQPDNFNLTTTNTGLIRTLWLHNDASNPAFTVIDTTLADYASLFLIQFKALQDIPVLSDVINLSPDDLPGGAWSDGEDCTRNVVMQFMPEGFADNRSSEQTDSENIINKIRVNPNPTTGALSFEITTDTPAENTIQIYSTTGQQVLRQSVYLEKGNNTVLMEDISNWQDGLYFYTITDASGLLRSGKFVKQ